MAAETNPLREGLFSEPVPDPCAVVIFGASGDLAHRKLVPALYQLALHHRLPAQFAVVGFARTAMSDDVVIRMLSRGLPVEFVSQQCCSRQIRRMTA